MLISVAVKLNSVLQARFPCGYRHDIIQWAMRRQGWSGLETAKRAKVHYSTARTVFAGRATNKAVWPIVDALGLDWTAIHNLKLKKDDFHLALNGGKAG